MRKIIFGFVVSGCLIPICLVAGMIYSVIFSGMILLRAAMYGVLCGVLLAAMIQLFVLRYRKNAVQEGQIGNAVSYMLYFLPIMELLFCIGIVVIFIL